MKKLISLLLAMLMIFSVATVAFAADADPEDPAVVDTEGDEDAAEEDSFEFTDLPFWTVKAGFKVAKIVLKLAKAFLKVASALGLVDTQELLQGLIDQITAAQEGESGDGETTNPLDGILDFTWLKTA